MKTLILAWLFATGLLLAQEVLTNESILKMTKSGLSDDVMIGLIHTRPGNYALSPDDLVNLKKQGVSNNVLSAMVNKGSGGAGAEAATAKPAQSNAPDESLDLPANLDVGVYYKKAGRWEEMLPEVVTPKTGGLLKQLATEGFVKGDINGHLQGANSKSSATTPLEVVIYALEGVSITEYQLLHLRQQKDSREFRTVTGGILHSSGGAARDLIPFEGKKVASRTFRILLPNLGAGEYGFLPPGAIGSASSASIGKLYSFRIIE